jgi:hypothetical protein
VIVYTNASSIPARSNNMDPGLPVNGFPKWRGRGA